MATKCPTCGRSVVGQEKPAPAPVYQLKRERNKTTIEVLKALDFLIGDPQRQPVRTFSDGDDIIDINAIFGSLSFLTDGVGIVFPVEDAWESYPYGPGDKYRKHRSLADLLNRIDGLITKHKKKCLKRITEDQENIKRLGDTVGKLNCHQATILNKIASQARR